MSGSTTRLPALTESAPAEFCPVCDRDLPAGQALCEHCFGDLPALAAETRVAVHRGGLAGPGDAAAMAARFLVLDRNAIMETARDRRFAPIGALATCLGIAGTLAPTVGGAASLVALTLFKFAALYMPAVLFTHMLARLMGGRGTYGEILRAFHLTNLVYGVGLVPVLGRVFMPIFALWDLVVSTYVLMVVHRISASRAVWVQVVTVMAIWAAIAAFPILGI